MYNLIYAMLYLTKSISAHPKYPFTSWFFINFLKPCRRQVQIIVNPINHINPNLYWLLILYFLKSFNPV